MFEKDFWGGGIFIVTFWCSYGSALDCGGSGGITYWHIIVLFEFNPMRDFEVVYLFKQIQSMSDRRDIQILQCIMIQMHQYIPRNLIFYTHRVSIRNKHPPSESKTAQQPLGQGERTFELFEILWQLHGCR
jgi:hypothetical protein